MCASIAAFSAAWRDRRFLRATAALVPSGRTAITRHHAFKLGTEAVKPRASCSRSFDYADGLCNTERLAGATARAWLCDVTSLMCRSLTRMCGSHAGAAPAGELQRFA